MGGVEADTGVTGVPPPALAGVEHRTVRARTPHGPLAIHLAEAGAGSAVAAPPLLLLHGWPQHWWTWRRVVPLLARDFRLLIPDLRGFGWTEAPGRGYDPVTFATDAVALLDALGIPRAGVIGHDWGGFTAYLLALRHPERITGAVACNTPHPWARVPVRELRRGWYAAVLASPAGPRLVVTRRFGDGLARIGERAGAFSAADAELYAARLREPTRARATQLLYRGYVRSAEDLLLRRGGPGGRRLTVPVRAVFGTGDPAIPVAATLGAERYANDFSARLLDGCGHWTPEERPAAVAAAARQLFS